MSGYTDKHDAIMRMRNWWAVVRGPGIFPAVAIGTGLLYGDGSGDKHRVELVTVNTTLCPYDAEKGVCSQTEASIDLYLGLMSCTPQLYKALWHLTQEPDNSAYRRKARGVLDLVLEPTGYLRNCAKEEG